MEVEFALVRVPLGNRVSGNKAFNDVVMRIALLALVLGKME